MKKGMAKWSIAVFLTAILLCVSLNLLAWADVDVSTSVEETHVVDTIDPGGGGAEEPLPPVESTEAEPENAEKEENPAPRPDGDAPTPEGPDPNRQEVENEETPAPKPNAEASVELMTETKPPPIEPEPVVRFENGYGIVASGAKLYKKPNKKGLLGSFEAEGMVYAMELVEKNGAWLNVSFAEQVEGELRIVEGYVNAKYVEPMDEKAVQKEIERLQKEKAVCYYDGQNTLPLAVLSFEWYEIMPADAAAESDDDADSIVEWIKPPPVEMAAPKPQAVEQQSDERVAPEICEAEPEVSDQTAREEAGGDEESGDDEPGDGQPGEDESGGQLEHEPGEVPSYDPQPQTMEAVQAAIAAYELEYRAALDAEDPAAALEVEKAHWQHQVADELMPEGYYCALVENDERFGAVYYTFFADEPGPGDVEPDEPPEPGPEETAPYDPQPETMVEVQAAIDAYELEYRAALDAEGPEAALEVEKAHWQHQVAAELMPEGYCCALVEDDERFGAVYYTFFADEAGPEDAETDEPPEGEPDEVTPYDPQPQTMQAVQAAIDAYEEAYSAALKAEGLLAALDVRKPRWQFEVSAELMPDGYRCGLVEDDEDFGADYYTFFVSESGSEGDLTGEVTPLYDPQPTTMEEVQAAIDAYEQEYLAVLEAEGFEAALLVRKPHWQYEVPEELMPPGYTCELVDYDEDFGAEYYTFFFTPMPVGYGESGYKVEPPDGTDITGLFTLIGQAKQDPNYENVARITEDASNRQGIMWSTTKLDLYQPFTTKMQLYLGHKDPAPNAQSPADGMTFTMHNDGRGASAIGGFGEGLGVYRGRTAGDFQAGRHIENALVIELDTYQNDGYGPVADPSAPHCALVIPKRGSKAEDDKITIADHKQLFPFTVVQDWVEFDLSWMPCLTNEGLGGTLSYSFGGSSTTYEIENVRDIFNGTEVWWGFSGSTGLRTALQAAAIKKLPFPPDPPETFDFSFVKVDAENNAILLSGAKFKLYACTIEHTHGELAITGSCWYNGETYQATSGENGLVAFPALAPGEYQLVEVAAPGGYQLPLGQWRFSIGEDGEIAFVSLSGPKPPAFKNIGTEEEPVYRLGNIKKFAIPMTGGQGVFLTLALGVLLLAAGVVSLGYFCRKARKSQSMTACTYAKGVHRRRYTNFG